LKEATSPVIFQPLKGARGIMAALLMNSAVVDHRNWSIHPMNALVRNAFESNLTPNDSDFDRWRQIKEQYVCAVVPHRLTHYILDQLYRKRQPLPPMR
jgi:hypothetical protein